MSKIWQKIVNLALYKQHEQVMSEFFKMKRMF